MDDQNKDLHFFAPRTAVRPGPVAAPDRCAILGCNTGLAPRFHESGEAALYAPDTAGAAAAVSGNEVTGLSLGDEFEVELDWSLALEQVTRYIKRMAEIRNAANADQSMLTLYNSGLQNQFFRPLPVQISDTARPVDVLHCNAAHV